MTLTTTQVRRLLADHHIRPSKGLGQNFVADPNTVRRVARLAGVVPGSRVVEVGPGLGSLTLALVEAGAEVLAVEVDRRLAEVTREVTAGMPVEVVVGDAMSLSWVHALRERTGPTVASPWALVANLPYNVATPVLVTVLEGVPEIRSLTVMVQREVGERLVAGPGDDAYGAVSAKVRYWSDAVILGAVPPSVFIPRPNVESVLVRLERRDRPAVDPAVVSYERLFSVVRAGFAQRRKTLRRALAGLVDEEAFECSGVPGRARAQELDLEAWEALAAWPDR